MEKLELKFPVFSLMAKEENPEGVAEFDPTVPTKKSTGPKRSITNKPSWVKILPRVKTVWSPIILDDALPIFETMDAANILIGEDQLGIKFGELDIVSLGSLQEIKSLIEKIIDLPKIRFYVLRTTGLANLSLATTEILISDFLASVKEVGEEK